MDAPVLVRSHFSCAIGTTLAELEEHFRVGEVDPLANPDYPWMRATRIVGKKPTTVYNGVTEWWTVEYRPLGCA